MNLYSLNYFVFVGRPCCEWREAQEADVTQVIGFFAGFFTTAAFVPQVIHAWRTRSTRDLSLLTIVAFTVGISLWVAYGVLIHSLPLVMWNATTLILNLGILIAKLRHG